MSEGFFNLQQTESKSRPQGKVLSCASCGLSNGVLSPRMKPFGNFKMGILNIGEAPGAIEDKRGRQWQGRVGKSLQEAYREFDIDLFEDCININAVNCRPPNNRKPTNQEIACCRKRVLDIISEYQPQVIMLFGEAALQSVIGHRWKKGLGSISKWRGWQIPDRDFKAWICPCYHPSYMERGEEEVETIWFQDLEQGLSMVDEPFPNPPNEDKQVIIAEEGGELETVLRDLVTGSFPPDPPLLSLDIETTGKKPHAEGHRIICWGFCDSPGTAAAFTHPKRRGNLQALKGVLTSKIGKVAHNMKFEQTWISHLLGYDVENWEWDTMLAAHVLDNRPDITSLKFQAYVNFGVIDYASEVERYLRGVDSKNANSKNTIEKLVSTEQGRRELLTYCGMDALFTYKLALKQMEMI
jgi:uracil-DNA glycosylase family 4